MYIVEFRADPPLFWNGRGWSQDQWTANEFEHRKEALSRAMRLRNSLTEPYKGKVYVKAVP